jgi:hypothetical protein
MKILSGWKKIASHLRQNVRTVQRWELIGLPVHRPKAGPQSQVIAFDEELDVWAEAAPTGVFKTITDLKAKVARLEEELRNLKHAIKGAGYHQSSRKAHERGEAARASSSRHSRELLRMRQAGSDAAEKVSASKKRQQGRATV